jgi:hypothetical protein
MIVMMEPRLKKAKMKKRKKPNKYQQKETKKKLRKMEKNRLSKSPQLSSSNNLLSLHKSQ